MEFKKFTAGSKAYGIKDPCLDKAVLKTLGITNVNFEDPRIEKDLLPGSDNYPFLDSFLEILSVCHTIIVEEKDG